MVLGATIGDYAAAVGTGVDLWAWSVVVTQSQTNYKPPGADPADMQL